MEDHAFHRKLKDTGNFLLLKDDVGRAKPSIHHLPPPNFTYGKLCLRDREGAGVVLSSWKSHHGTEESQPPGRDFIKLNANGVAAGCHTAKQLHEFRSSHDNRVSSPSIRVRQSSPEFDMVHGVKCRPSTPMDQVMTNLYGRQAEAEKHQIYSRQLQHPPIESPINSIKLPNPYQLPGRDPFKMRKFRAVSPRTDSYVRRVPTAWQRRRALSSMSSGNK
jgi:hypothetical protein